MVAYWHIGQDKDLVHFELAAQPLVVDYKEALVELLVVQDYGMIPWVQQPDSVEGVLARYPLAVAAKVVPRNFARPAVEGE